MRDAIIDMEMEYQRNKDEVDGTSKEDAHYGQSSAVIYLKSLGITCNPKSTAFKKLGNMFSKAMAEGCYKTLRYRFISRLYSPFYLPIMGLKDVRNVIDI